MVKPITEFDIHRALVLWLRGNPDRDGNPRTTPALASGVVFWHTPNGGERRDAFEGKRLKELGTLAGIHDLLFLAQGRLFGLELKKPGGRPSPAQIALHPRLLEAGMVASAVVDNLDDAKAFCRLHRLSRG